MEKDNKKNVFKYFARLNSKKNNKGQNSNPDSGEDKSNKKSKNWIIGLSVAGVAAIGIGLAVGLTTTSATKIEALKNEEVLYEIKIPGGGVKKITVSDVVAASKNFFDEDQGEFAKAKRELVQYLYKKEVDASDLFQKAWNSSKEDGEADRNFKLETLEQVREKEAKNLEDQKRTFQRSFGVQNWESEWKKELGTDKYGKSSTEEQAIEFLVLRTIRNQAYGRWLPYIESSFSKKDIEERKAKEDISYTNSAQQVVVVYPKGERIFKNFLNTKNTINNANEVNAIFPNINGNEINEKTLASAFLTKSFDPEYRKTNKLINSYVDTFSSAFNFSEVIIPAKQDANSAALSWEITKKDLVDLLLYRVLDNVDNNLNVKQNIELITSFEGALGKTSQQNENDKLLLNTLNSQINVQNVLGAKPLSNIFEIFKNEEISYANGFLSNLYKAKDVPNLFAELLEKIKGVLFNDVNKEVYMPSSASLSTKKINEIEKINVNLENEINKLSDDQVKSLVGQVFRDVFATSQTDFRTKTIYKIAENKYVFLSSKGVHFVVLQKLENLNQFNEVIRQQLQLEANSKIDKSIKPSTDISKTFSYINGEDMIFAQMIKDVEFQNYLKEKLAKNSSDDKKLELINSLTKIGQRIQDNFYINASLESQQKINAYLNQTIDNNINSDYEFNKSIADFSISGSNNSKPMAVAIYEAIRKLGGK
ncbi:HinT-interacting membrane complex protein P80 [Candidatus Mycoplasma pogonae]